MKLLAILCRHHLLKKFQHARLKHTMIYTRLSPHKPLSQIPTANSPLISMAELSTTKNTTRTVTSSVSPPQGQRTDVSGRPDRDLESPATSQFGILAGTFLRHKAQSLGFRVLPDGFIRVNEILNHSQHFRGISFDEFKEFVENDPMSRFEMTFRSDLMVDGGKLKDVWWVRAKYGHTMRGVDHATRRIIHVGKLRTVHYVTHESNWERIREYGIPQGPDYLIELFYMSPYNNLILDEMPEQASVLRISIDPFKAVDLGVKFFHTKNVELIACGGWNHTIPPAAFKNVAILHFDKETLKSDIVPPHDSQAPNDTLRRRSRSRID